MADLSHTDARAKMLLLVSGGGAMSMEDLQFAGYSKTGETFGAGSLCSLNSAGTIEAGLNAATSMPLFAINGVADYDAGQYAYNYLKAVGDYDGTRMGGSIINTLVATGGFEIQTTEYNSDDFAEALYVKGTTPLTEDTTTAGYVEPAASAYSLLPVVGIVSMGIASSTNATGMNLARIRTSAKKLLRFWTAHHLPVKTS